LTEKKVVAELAVVAQLTVHLTTNHEIAHLNLASSSTGRKWPRSELMYSVSKKSTINRALEVDYLKLASTWYQEKMAEKKPS